MSTSMMQFVTVFGTLLILSLAKVNGIVVKRGVSDFGLSSFGGGFNGIPSSQDISFGFPSILSPQPVPVFVKSAPIITSGITIQKHLPAYQPPVSSSEIAAALSAAKEASSRVTYLQSRVQAAKDALVEQQQIARAKESAAATALQRSEAAAAAQRQAASAAANAVISAQQRLAEAKAEVAEQQRIAAAKEQYAANIIQRSASAAAAEIQRTEDTAAKIAAIQRSEAAAAIQHVTATKDATLSATASAVAASNNINGGHGPAPTGSGSQYQQQQQQQQQGKYQPWN